MKKSTQSQTLCTSVRIESIRSISEKAVVITAFDGSSDIFPKSVIFGYDNEVQKCDAVWIASWILQNKKLQYSGKKQAWFDDSGRMVGTVFTKHVPTKINPLDNNEIPSLKSE